MQKRYVIYLRKSRADAEAELHGEGETLARHKKLLLGLAKKMKIPVSAIYEEIVSGETIAARPQMQKLLSEVEQGLWTGVLVVEVERLARGDTMDQGLVAQTFKYSNTKIITPAKTYDPSNEFDEEYFEFGLFMSRREYKTINRRLQRGRIAAINEGKYIAGTAPFGYEKIRCKDGKGYTLKIDPEKARTVKYIYELYTKGDLQDDNSYKPLGMYLIAKKLDSMGIKPQRKDSWSTATIKDILTNPTYTGKVRWQWRKCVKDMKNGLISVSRPKDKDCIITEGLHQPIIDEIIFEKAQKILSTRSNPPVADNMKLKNPLIGLVKCGLCGKTMTRVYSNTKAGYYMLKCPNRSCGNISAPIYRIEDKILDGLSDWLENYRLDLKAEPCVPDYTIHENAIAQIEKEILLCKKQLENTYDLLEREIYDTDTFLQRNQGLTDKINSLELSLKNEKHKMEKEKSLSEISSHFIPKIETIIDTYNDIEDPLVKNQMLKEVIDYASYVKTERAKRGKRDDIEFTLKLHPSVPK